MKLSGRRLISEILQSNRYRLLFLIHERGKIEATEGTKTRLKNTLGYTSDGPFYNDLKFFKESGLVEEGERWMRITRKGRRELLVVTAPFLSGLFSAFYAAIFVLNKLTSTPSLNPIIVELSPWLTSFLPFLVIAFFNFYVYLILKPKLSSEERNFR